jgi:hypothetical protein
MKAVSALQKKAEHPRQRKNNITKTLLMLPINDHTEKIACATSLLSVLGKETRTASALENKAERARQTRKANKSQPLAASTYYHPLSPLPTGLTILLLLTWAVLRILWKYDSID